MTSSFASRNWKEALQAVHEFNWRKWHVLKDKLPLEKGQVEQVPGKIPEHIFLDLKPFIDELPPLKRYGARQSK